MVDPAGGPDVGRHGAHAAPLQPDRVAAPGPAGRERLPVFDQEQLLRLQQILLLRELGMDLAKIAAVVVGEQDQVEALRVHHRRLLAERDRLDRLARSVAATITGLERGIAMPAEELFVGFRFTAEVIADLEARSHPARGVADPAGH